MPTSNTANIFGGTFPQLQLRFNSGLHRILARFPERGFHVRIGRRSVVTGSVWRDAPDGRGDLGWPPDREGAKPKVLRRAVELRRQFHRHRRPYVRKRTNFSLPKRCILIERTVIATKAVTPDRCGQWVPTASPNIYHNRR